MPVWLPCACWSPSFASSFPGHSATLLTPLPTPPRVPPSLSRGYEGDGKTCAANAAALQQLEALYWSEPQGLACDAGYDVAWPDTSPGEGDSKTKQRLL